MQHYNLTCLRAVTIDDNTCRVEINFFYAAVVDAFIVTEKVFLSGDDKPLSYINTFADYDKALEHYQRQVAFRS